MKPILPAAEDQARDAVEPVSLTPRQLEILSLVAQGATDNEIALRLVISAQTVSVHVRAIRQAFGARSRSQAVALALQQGVLPAEPTEVTETSP